MKWWRLSRWRTDSWKWVYLWTRVPAFTVFHGSVVVLRALKRIEAVGSRLLIPDQHICSPRLRIGLIVPVRLQNTSPTNALWIQHFQPGSSHQSEDGRRPALFTWSLLCHLMESVFIISDENEYISKPLHKTYYWPLKHWKLYNK